MRTCLAFLISRRREFSGKWRRVRDREWMDCQALAVSRTKTKLRFATFISKNLIELFLLEMSKSLINLNVTALTAISTPGRIGEVLHSTLGRKMSSKWQRRKSYWFESGMKPFNVKDLESKYSCK